MRCPRLFGLLVVVIVSSILSARCEAKRDPGDTRERLLTSFKRGDKDFAESTDSYKLTHFSYIGTLATAFGRPDLPSELDPEELRDPLKHLAQTEPNLFTTPEAVTQTLEDLNRDIREACTRYPGVETRTCFLDKTYDEIYERLTMRLTAGQEEDLLSTLPMLFSGDQQAITPPGTDAANGSLGLVPAALVNRAASVLEGLPPEAR